MSDHKLIIGPFAEMDLKQAKDYYEMQKEGLGDEFVDELGLTLKTIVENPLQYPKAKKEMRKANMKRFPYSIFFIFKEQIVNILSIFHSSRNPKVWKKRLQ